MLAKLRHLNLFYVQIMIEIKNKPKKKYMWQQKKLIVENLRTPNYNPPFTIV